MGYQFCLRTRCSPALYTTHAHYTKRELYSDLLHVKLFHDYQNTILFHLHNSVVEEQQEQTGSGHLQCCDARVCHALAEADRGSLRNSDLESILLMAHVRLVHLSDCEWQLRCGLERMQTKDIPADKAKLRCLLRSVRRVAENMVRSKDVRHRTLSR